MAKCVYRYNDYNRVGDGQAEVVLIRRAVIRETECYLWHIDPPMGANAETWDAENCRIDALKPWYPGHVIKTRKGAMRSAWHATPEEALAARRNRKWYQVRKLRLALERVELCIAAHDANAPRNVVPQVINAGAGPEQSKYDWREY